MVDLSDKLKNFFLGFGLYIGKSKSLIEIRELIELLHPVKVDLIRVGGNGDGGYLIPNDLKDIKACFSPGVSTTSTFESELEFFGIFSYLADYSVDAPTNLSKNHIFLKKYVAPFNSENSVDFQEWILANSSRGEDYILQMDIEGAEYATLLSCNREILKRFRILVIEFHHLDLLFNAQAFSFIQNCFKKILNDFYVVHIHPNNATPTRKRNNISIPITMEFTFLRRDRVSQLRYAHLFPHELDKPNISKKSDLPLPPIWFD